MIGDGYNTFSRSVTTHPTPVSHYLASCISIAYWFGIGRGKLITCCLRNYILI